MVGCIFSCFGVCFVVFVVCACLACPLVFDSFVSCRVCGLSVGCDCGCCCGLAWCRVQCSVLAVALCCPSFLLQLRCSGPVQLCLLSVWPRSHWSVAVTGCPHLAQVCVSPVASRASHALRRWRCAASYPLAVELPRCRSYAWAWAWQNLCPCGTSCGQLCQAHRRRLTVESSSLWWCVWCFVPESDRLWWNALLSSWLCVQYGAMVGWGPTVGVCAFRLLLPLSYRSWI